MYANAKYWHQDTLGFNISLNECIVCFLRDVIYTNSHNAPQSQHLNK